MDMQFAERRLWPELKDIPIGVHYELIEANGNGLFVETFIGETITADELQEEFEQFCDMIDHLQNSTN